MQRSNYWFSDGGTQVKCPVEGCTHVGDGITKAHLRITHGLTQEETKKQYGMPFKLAVNPKAKYTNLLSR